MRENLAAMSDTLHPAPLRPDRPDAGSGALQALRGELDRLDDQLHDTLMRRAEVVAKVSALNVKGAVPVRPGREAAIIRRLLARHAGPLPPLGVARIWRELLAGTTSQQRPMLIAVCEPSAGPSLVALAREHFGALTPVAARTTPAQAMADVSSGAATAAGVPVPAELLNAVGTFLSLTIPLDGLPFRVQSGSVRVADANLVVDATVSNVSFATV